MRVLGIETSCDETAAAVVEDGLRLLSNVVYSQVQAHAPFGGVVPEIASREHIGRIDQVVRQALEPVGGVGAIDAVAVTQGPGLLGCLLVGLQFAKGLAMVRDVPFLGIHHLEGHLSACMLADNPPGYPHVALLVSGGHTQLFEVRSFAQYRLLGSTRDDAAGEAFDKVAKILNLGYPGGVRIEQQSAGGDAKAIKLPRAWLGQSLDFSFSGLKTAASLYVQRAGGTLPLGQLADFCASLQEAIVDVLSRKAVSAALQVGAPGVVLAGGVAANSRLRALLDERCRVAGLWSFAPPKVLCTDNAAMIAAAGWQRLQLGEQSLLTIPARSRWALSMVPHA